MNYYVKRVPRFAAICHNSRNIHEIITFLDHHGVQYTYDSGERIFRLNQNHPNREEGVDPKIVFRYQYWLVITTTNKLELYTNKAFRKKFELENVNNDRTS